MAYKTLTLAQLTFLNFISYFTALTTMIQLYRSFFFEWSKLYPLQGLPPTCTLCLECTVLCHHSGLHLILPFREAFTDHPNKVATLMVSISSDPDF